MTLLSVFPQYQCHIVCMLILVAMAWVKVADRFASECQWYAAVKVGIKGVLIAEGDTWSMARIGKPVQLSWCLSVTETQTFLYQYNPYRVGA